MTYTKFKDRLLDFHFGKSKVPLEPFISVQRKIPIVALDISQNDFITSYRLFDVMLVYNKTLKSLTLGQFCDTDFRYLSSNRTLRHLKIEYLHPGICKDLFNNVSRSNLSSFNVTVSHYTTYEYYEEDISKLFLNLRSVTIRGFSDVSGSEPTKNILFLPSILGSMRLKRLSLRNGNLCAHDFNLDKTQCLNLKEKLISLFRRLKVLKLNSYAPVNQGHLRCNPIILDAIIETIERGCILRKLSIITDMSDLVYYLRLCNALRYNNTIKSVCIDFRIFRTRGPIDLEETVNATNQIFLTNTTITNFVFRGKRCDQAPEFRSIATYLESVKQNKLNVKKGKTLFSLLMRRLEL